MIYDKILQTFANVQTAMLECFVATAQDILMTPETPDVPKRRDALEELKVAIQERTSSLAQILQKKLTTLDQIAFVPAANPGTEGGVARHVDATADAQVAEPEEYGDDDFDQGEGPSGEEHVDAEESVEEWPGPEAGRQNVLPPGEDSVGDLIDA